MILTAEPGKSTILQTTKKEYVTLEEAETNLKEKFLQAIYSKQNGVHIVKIQTGISKKNLYLNYLHQNTDRKFLIAVPTYKLKNVGAGKVLMTMLSELCEKMDYDNPDYHALTK